MPVTYDKLLGEPLLHSHDTVYLKLDASNDPVTGPLSLSTSSTTESGLTISANDDGGYGTRGIIKGINNSTGNRSFIFGGGNAGDYASFYLFGRSNGYGGFGDRIFEFIGMDDRIGGDKRIGGFILERNALASQVGLWEYAGEQYMGHNRGGWIYGLNGQNYSTEPLALMHLAASKTVPVYTTETVDPVSTFSATEISQTSNFPYGTNISYQAFAFKVAGDAVAFFEPTGYYIGGLSINTDYSSAVQIYVDVPTGADGVRIMRTLDSVNWEYYDVGSSGYYTDDNNYGMGISWAGYTSNPPTPQSPYLWASGTRGVTFRADDGDVEFYSSAAPAIPNFRFDSLTSTITLVPDSGYSGIIVKCVGSGGDYATAPIRIQTSDGLDCVSFNNGEQFSQDMGFMQLIGSESTDYHGEFDFLNRDIAGGDKRCGMIVGKKGADSSYGGIEIGVLNGGSLVDGLEVMPDQIIRMWNSIDYRQGGASTPSNTSTVVAWAELKLAGTSYRIPLYQ